MIHQPLVGAYTLCLLVSVAFLLLRHPVTRFLTYFGLRFILRCLVYPLVSTRWRWTAKSWIKVVSYTSYWALTICCSLVSAGTPKLIGERAAVLALANCLPILFSSHMALCTRLFRLPLYLSNNIHKICGSTAIGLGVLHMILALAVDASNPFSTNLFGALAGTSTLLLAVLSIISFFRRRFPLFCRCLHEALGLALVVFVYFHIGDSRKESAVFVIVIGSLCGLLYTVQAITSLSQFTRRYPCSLEFNEDGKDKEFISLMVTLASVPVLRAGQFVRIYPRHSWYLRGFTLPIALAWCSTESGNESTLLSWIHRRSSLGQYLESARYKSVRIAVLGPYGISTNLDDYGTIVLLATDLGMVPLHHHFKQILQHRNNGESRTVAVVVAWQLSTTRSFIPTLAHDMNEMAEQKHTSISISFFSPDPSTLRRESANVRGDEAAKGQAEEELKTAQQRITYKGGEASWADIIADAFTERMGPMLVISSTGIEDQHLIREKMSQIGQKDAQLLEMPSID